MTKDELEKELKASGFSDNDADELLFSYYQKAPEDTPKRALLKILIAGGFLGFITAFIFTPSSDDYSESEPAILVAEDATEIEVPDPNISLAAKTLVALTSSPLVEPADSDNIVTESTVLTFSADDIKGKGKPLTLRSGENLVSLLRRGGASASDANRASHALNKIHDLRRLKPGQKVVIQTDKGLYGVVLSNKDGSNFSVVRDDMGNYIPTTKEAKIEVRKSTVSGEIKDSSFSASAERYKIPSSISSQMTRAFNDVINFKKDLKKGDSFEAVYEQRFNEAGEDLGNGRLLFASISTAGKTYNRYYFKNKKGAWDYYDENGNSVKKAINVWPMGKARVTSSFGTRRHPILLYTTTHWGIDYAAKVGTPIGAAADGTVVFIGRRGGYGKYMQIKHSNGYSTAYAHLNAYNRNLRIGSFVKQGQIIAFSGNTGRSTGPHLHFEVINGNRKVNPLRGNYMLSHKLKGQDMRDFIITCKKSNSNYNVAENINDKVKTR